MFLTENQHLQCHAVRVKSPKIALRKGAAGVAGEILVQGGHPICARCAFVVTTLHSQSASQYSLAHSGRSRCAA